MDELVAAMEGLYQEPVSRRWYVVALPPDGDRLVLAPWSRGQSRPRRREKVQRVTPASLVVRGLVKMGEVPPSYVLELD